jgi:CRAL/TRIO domain
MTLVADLKTFPDTVEPALPLQIECLHLVQAHYPERMGRAVVGHAPAMFWLMWKAITPFIDPVTKAKVAFCTTDAAVREETRAHIGLELLYETLGGEKPEHDLDLAESEGRLRSLELARRRELEATAARMGDEAKGWECKLARWADDGEKEEEEEEVEKKEAPASTTAAAPASPQKPGLLSSLSNSFSLFAVSQREN